MQFFTIGYGGRTPTDFLSMLGEAKINLVVDVRLRPDKASIGSYAKARSPDKGIEALLASQGIGYQSLPELGNVFLDDPDWPRLYTTLIAQSGELLTRRLRCLPGPYSLLCAEKRVAECHRRIIADFLVAEGHEAIHLE